MNLSCIRFGLIFDVSDLCHDLIEMSFYKCSKMTNYYLRVNLCFRRVVLLRPHYRSKELTIFICTPWLSIWGHKTGRQVEMLKCLYLIVRCDLSEYFLPLLNRFESKYMCQLIKLYSKYQRGPWMWPRLTNGFNNCSLKPVIQYWQCLVTLDPMILPWWKFGLVVQDQIASLTTPYDRHIIR